MIAGSPSVEAMKMGGTTKWGSSGRTSIWAFWSKLCPICRTAGGLVWATMFGLGERSDLALELERFRTDFLIHAVVSIRTLLYAVIKSCLPVEHISIEFGDLMAGCICVILKMLLLLRNLERAVSSQLHTVTTLRLMVNLTPRDNKFDCEMPPMDPTSGETQGWISEFLAFLGLFTAISDLNLFPELSQLLLVPGLRTLHLGFLDCTISELTALLERHEATLQTVSLKSVSLIGEGLDSWLSVVAFLRHKLLVEVLYLEGCFSEDIEHRTHIMLLRSLYAENPQELDELVVELKHTQKKEDRIS
ncbi:F-box domain-containing protein [Colletotrichum asianum]